MALTRNRLVLIAAGGSALALAFALFSQYVLGLYPCPLCIWQRWPHLAAVVLGPAALAVAGPVVPLLGAAAALTTAGIGLYHTGVERGVFAGLESCAAGPGIGGLSVEQLLDPTIAVGHAVRCDEVVASFAGLSMASWNAIAALALAAVWIAAARARA
ncbi:MAG: disulfide bond formation protein B [Gemmobacter sp.]